METLAWRVVVWAGLLVFIFGLLDCAFGTDLNNKSTVFHFFAVAGQGVACSVMASATYSLFVEARHAREREKLRDDFIGLFGLPEMIGRIKCYIVVPTKDNIMMTIKDQDGNEFVVDGPLAVPTQAEPDVACASELQALITTVLGTSPQRVSPAEAIDIANSSTDPSVVFSVGLWSNPFTLFLAAGGQHSLQRLFRLPVENVTNVQIAKPTPSGEYNVDADADITDVPGEYKGREVVLLRIRGPKKGHVACVVVGGLTGEGTGVIGQYIRDNWRALCLRTDTSAHAHCVRNRQYLLNLKAFTTGAVAPTAVLVGPSLVR